MYIMGGGGAGIQQLLLHIGHVLCMVLCFHGACMPKVAVVTGAMRLLHLHVYCFKVAETGVSLCKQAVS